jgi:phage-related protein (TIGR01555 family)
VGSRIWHTIFGYPKAENTPAKRRAGILGAAWGNDDPERFDVNAHLAQLRARAPHAAATLDDDGMSVLKGAYANNGGAIPEAMVAWYASHSFVGWQMSALLSQQWLINKACSVPVTDALRHGFDIISDTGNLDNQELQKLKISLREHEVKHNLHRFLRKGRIFGLMFAIFKVDTDDPDYYRNPFNEDAVAPGSYKGITLVEPYWCSPQLAAEDVNDPASKDFYNPTWWRIYDKLYHRSHLCVFRMDEVPDILKPMYYYGGMSIPQKILSRVYAAERTADEAPALAMSKRTTIFKVDSDTALENEYEFKEKLLRWIGLRDNFAVKVIDKESEDLNQIDTTLTDFDAVMMGQYQLVAAASDVPATKLLGTTPKGFNSTGEYEESSYHETLESIQEEFGTPFLERHLLLAARSEGIRTDDLVLTVAWKPTDSQTAAEYATIRKTMIEGDAILIEAGVIDADQVKDRLYADENSGFEKPECDPAELRELFDKLERQGDALLAEAGEVTGETDTGDDDLQEKFDELSRLGEDAFKDKSRKG